MLILAKQRFGFLKGLAGDVRPDPTNPKGLSDQ